jgi:hypothetical protein
MFSLPLIAIVTTKEILGRERNSVVFEVGVRELRALDRPAIEHLVVNGFERVKFERRKRPELTRGNPEPMRRSREGPQLEPEALVSYCFIVG